MIGLNIDEKEKLYEINMHSQKICRLFFLENNLIAAAETEIRLIDFEGQELTSYFVNKSNGNITDIELEGEHLYITTSMKQLALFDILQQKKIGNFFNDFTLFPDDKLPDEKELSCAAICNDGLALVLGGASGNLYILRT